MIPNFKDVDVTINDDGTATAKYKPMESVCYDNGLVELLESYDPPPMSEKDMDILLKFLDD